MRYTSKIARSWWIGMTPALLVLSFFVLAVWARSGNMTAMLVGIGVLVLAPAATIAGALLVNRSLHFVEVASGTITVSAGFRRNATVPASEVELHVRRHSIRPWRWEFSASKRKLRPLLLLGGFYFDREKAELLCKEVRSAGGTVETS